MIVNDVISDTFDNYFQLQNNEKIHNIHSTENKNSSDKFCLITSNTSLNIFTPHSFANKIIKKGTKKWNKITKSFYGNSNI